MPGADFGGHRHVFLVQRFDRDALQPRLEDIAQALAVDQTGSRQIEIKEAKNPATGEAARKVFQGVELAGHVAAADDSADGRAGDDVGIDASFVERPEDADMRPSPSRSAPKG
jgi:hypothetical protein